MPLGVQLPGQVTWQRIPPRPGFPSLLENTRLLANPLASPEDIEDLDGWTLHRLRHSALTHDAEGSISNPMLPARSRHAPVRFLERCARPGVDAGIQPLAGDSEIIRLADRWGARTAASPGLEKIRPFSGRNAGRS
ncbi:hypothetical protein [Streptomyces shenzhenensis]|uniref:hypothetical protein n=1 Tax=Streptomyces shenzhenensis TaxID=943815 RepID=UPI00340C781C